MVDNKQKLIGSLTDGDIRPWIIKGGNISSCIERNCNKKPVIAEENYQEEQIKNKILTQRIECIPVVSQDKKIVDLWFWDEIYGKCF